MAIIEGWVTGLKNGSNSNNIDIHPSLFSYNLEESIHSLLPTGKITLSNPAGIFTEGGLFINGFTLQVYLAVNKIKLSPKYTVFGYSTQPHSRPEGFSPKLELLLKHDWINKQSIKSAAYKNRLSEVYKQLLTPDGFTFDFNDTGNDAYWYQNLETQIQFIERTLENCYSMNSSESPFFAYITSDNKFHLRNASSLENQSPKKTFYLRYSEGRKNFSDNIYSIQKIDDGSFSYLNHKAKNVFTMDRTTGNLISTVDQFIAHPLQRQGKILAQDIGTNVTSNIDMSYSETDIGLQENLKGQVINSYKKVYFLDRFTMAGIQDSDNLALRAGDTIELKVASMGGNTYNKLLSQKFVIEKKVEIWDGLQSQTSFVLVLGRRTATVPSSLFVFNQLS